MDAYPSSQSFTPSRKTSAVVLVNLGTPPDTSLKSLRVYLREFLMDPRVINLPYLNRWLLVNGIIAPMRPFKIKKNYEKIWMKEGSPLKVYTESLTHALQAEFDRELGDQSPEVIYAMRYGQPSIAYTTKKLAKQGITDVLIVPLYPQYASATIGSVYDAFFKQLRKLWHVPTTRGVRPFYNDPLFIEAAAEQAKPFMNNSYDAYLFSYHSLPSNHLTIGETGKNHCKMEDGCCGQSSPDNRFCYRAQCLTTTRLIAQALGVDPKKVLTSFQSRLGYSQWILPYTTNLIHELPKKGVKKLLVFSPSFVTDCIETLEEIGHTEKHNFLAQGGEVFDLVPCVNASPLWVKNFCTLLAKQR